MVRIVNIIMILIIIIFSSSVHEGMHGVSAKLLGFNVKSINIGFGFKLVEFYYKNTSIRYNIIPIGGFCYIEDINKESNNRREILFLSLKRIIVYLMGPISNFFLVFILFSIISVSFAGIEIKGTINNDFIMRNNISIGDRIVEIDKQRIMFYDKYKTIEYNFTVIDKNENKRLVSINGFNKDNSLNTLGIRLEENSIINRIKNSKVGIKNLTNGFLNIGTDIFSKTAKTRDMIKDTENLSTQLSTTLEGDLGFINGLLLYVGVFNFTLGFINLIPIPIFDGGRIAISICEIIFGRSINKTLIDVLLWVSLIVFITLDIYLRVLMTQN